jgi:hypothetical protein
MKRRARAACGSEEAEDAGDDAVHVGDLLLLDRGRVDGRGVHGADAQDGSIELVEGFFLDDSGDVAADGAVGALFLDDQHAVGFGDGAQDGVHVEGADGAQVDDLDVKTLGGAERLGGGEAVEDAATVGDDGEILAGAGDVCAPEGEGDVALGNLALLAVENGVFEEHDRVVVANGGLHERLGVGGVGGDDDLQARVVGEDVFDGVGVGGADIGAAVGGAADDDGAGDLAAGHVADVGGVVDDLVEGDRVEGPEHQLHDGADAEHGRADAETDETGLGDGRIDDAFGAILFEHALGDFVGAVKLGDFFAHDDDVGVAFDFFGECGSDGFAVSEDGHRESVARAG